MSLKNQKIFRKMKRSSCFLALAFLLIARPGISKAEIRTEEELSYKNFVAKISHDITLEIGGSENTLSRSTMEKWGKESSYLAYNPRYRSEIENIDFCRHKGSFMCELTFSVRKEYHIQKVSELEIDEKALATFLEDLERQVNRDPVNAKLKIEDGKVSAFSLSKKGVKLDKEKSLQAISDHLRQPEGPSRLKLPYLEIEPEISDDSIENLGITSLISEGRSDFKGSPKNRIFNINVATNRFNGILLKPGEEFSFVEILGPVDGEHGYLPELVIKHDKTEPEFGGGICQVSTTVFRAAINSGLKITARKAHAYAVQYYNPPGIDATIYIPRPDLRFVNNTPGYILIQTKIEGTELIFQFYGTDDGRKTKVLGPKILEKNPDGSMKTTFTQEVKDKDGNLIIEDVFNSAYASPSKYPHPGQQIFTEKPKDWSKKQWEKYKKENGL